MRVERKDFRLRVGFLVFDVAELHRHVPPYWFVAAVALLDPPPDKCEREVLLSVLPGPARLDEILAGDSEVFTAYRDRLDLRGPKFYRAVEADEDWMGRTVTVTQLVPEEW